MKLFVISCFVLFSFLFPIRAFGAPDHLQKFILIKNAQGQVQSVQIKSKLQIDMQKIINVFFPKKKQHLASWREFSTALTNPEATKQSIDSRSLATMKQAYDSLNEIDLQVLSKDSQFQQLLTRMNAKLLDFSTEWQTLANTENHRYFRNSHLKNELLTWAINLARTQLGSVPAASFILAIFNEALQGLEIRRGFYQSLLLHQLTQHKLSELGLKNEDFMGILSSLYEAQIELTQIAENKAIDADWIGYGVKKHRRQLQQISETVAEHEWQSFPKQSFNFCEIQAEGVHVVKNILVTKNGITSRLATAYSFDQASVNYRLRMTAVAVNMALDMLPLPSGAALAPHWFINSLFVQQVKSEGGLLGYWLESGRVAESKMLFQQTANVFIWSDSF